MRATRHPCNVRATFIDMRTARAYDAFPEVPLLAERSADANAHGDFVNSDLHHTQAIVLIRPPAMCRGSIASDAGSTPAANRQPSVWAVDSMRETVRDIVVRCGQGRLIPVFDGGLVLEESTDE